MSIPRIITLLCFLLLPACTTAHLSPQTHPFDSSLKILFTIEEWEEGEFGQRSLGHYLIKDLDTYTLKRFHCSSHNYENTHHSIRFSKVTTPDNPVLRTRFSIMLVDYDHDRIIPRMELFIDGELPLPSPEELSTYLTFNGNDPHPYRVRIKASQNEEMLLSDLEKTKQFAQGKPMICN